MCPSNSLHFATFTLISILITPHMAIPIFSHCHISTFHANHPSFSLITHLSHHHSHHLPKPIKSPSLTTFFHFTIHIKPALSHHPSHTHIHTTTRLCLHHSPPSLMFHHARHHTHTQALHLTHPNLPRISPFL